MTNTILPKVPREEMSEGIGMAWDALHGLSGDATFVEVFANAPDVLNFAMVDF